jgi:hypothetical protein
MHGIEAWDRCMGLMCGIEVQPSLLTSSLAPRRTMYSSPTISARSAASTRAWDPVGSDPTSEDPENTEIPRRACSTRNGILHTRIRGARVRDMRAWEGDGGARRVGSEMNLAARDPAARDLASGSISIRIQQHGIRIQHALAHNDGSGRAAAQWFVPK